MKIAFFIFIFLMPIQIISQEFECDGSLYLILFSESEGLTELYVIDEENEKFTFSQIVLSENRRLTGLTYNTTDLHLWAFDVDNFEMVRINSDGEVETMGKLENIDENLSYSSGLLSPTGLRYFFMGYDRDTDAAVKFYEVNLQNNNFYAEFDDISRASASRILDMAIDPVFGAVYGYNNLNGTIVQFGIDGQIATVSQSRREEQFIDALFFNRAGKMFGYTPQGEMYVIDKIEGNLLFLQRGPQGTDADGCACPYTSQFTKIIEQQLLIPCEPFEVKYKFRNNLGISQTSIQLRDTFPEGFEILNIASSIPYTRVEVESPNVLALNNMIYSMGFNTLIVTVQPSMTYFGSFSSRARQESFPAAFMSVQYSDDPDTEVMNDPTGAEVISENIVALEDQLSFSCDGQSAAIQSPLIASHYQWSTGSTDPFIEVSQPGWYTLLLEGICFSYMDSVFIDEFPDSKSASLGGDKTIVVGDSILLEPMLNRGTPVITQWAVNDIPVDCENCPDRWFAPEADVYVSVMVEDESGCITKDEILINVEYEKFIYGPNVFSPNGDGVNDVFYLSSSIPGKFKLSVYSRWGSLIFEKSNCELSNDAEGWDGFVNGRYIHSGSYIWVADIEYVSGEKETLYGDFLVVS